MSATETLDRRAKSEAGAEKGTPNGGRRPRARVVAPAVDIYEHQEQLHILVDLPGVTSDGVKLDVEKEVLTISAKPAQGAPEGQLVYGELQPVEYHRAFALGEDLDAARISATLKSGVLSLVLPKSERAKTKKIAIAAE